MLAIGLGTVIGGLRPAAGKAPPPAPAIALNMVQLTNESVEQRRTTRGGGLDRGQGTLRVSINPAERTPIYARTRDAFTGAIMQAPWQVSAAQPAAPATLVLGNVDVTPNWVHLDLASAPGGPWTLGTSLVAVGARVGTVSQSQGAMFISGHWGGQDSMSSQGVSPPERGSVRFHNGQPADWSGWSRMVDIPTEKPFGRVPYYGTGAAVFLAAEAERLGCVVALVGVGHGGRDIAYFGDPSREGYRLLPNLLEGGFEQLLFHQGGEDANRSRTTEQVAKDVTDVLTHCLSMKGAFEGAPKIVATAMATRATNTATQVLTVRRGMKQAVEALGGLYIEPRDVEVADDVHQTQAGNIVLAHHYLRAFKGEYDPPKMVSAERDGAVVTVTCDRPLVLKGNMNGRIAVFPQGTTETRLDTVSVAVDGDKVIITLAADPGGSTALDVWPYYHPDQRAAHLYGIYAAANGVQHLEPILSNPIPVAGGALAKPTATTIPSMTGSFVAGEPIAYQSAAFNDNPTSGRFRLDRSAGPVRESEASWQALSTANGYTPSAGDDHFWLRLTQWTSNAAGESDPVRSIIYGPVRRQPPSIRDDFTGVPSNTPITGRVLPTGQTWEVAPGFAAFQGINGNVGRIRPDSNNLSEMLISAALPADSYLEIDGYARTRSNTGYIGIVLRKQADGSKYLARKDYAYPNYLWRLVYVDAANASTVLASAVWDDAPQSLGAWAGRFEIKGDHLRLFIDGTLRLEARDTRIAAGGKVGLWGLGGTDGTREQPDAIRAGAL